LFVSIETLLLLAALSGFLVRLLALLAALSGLLVRLLALLAALSGLLVRLLVLLAALIFILSHRYLQFFVKHLLECYYSTNLLQVSRNAANASDLEKEKPKHSRRKFHLPERLLRLRFWKGTFRGG
jgi:hypothetical protein